MYNKIIGIIGGGQLGRMMVESGYKIGLQTAILDPNGNNSPSGKISQVVVKGSFHDINKVYELAKKSNIITIEIEHVNVDVLLELKKNGIKIRPDPLGIQIIQDKYLQKINMNKNNIPLGDFMEFKIDEEENIGNKFGYPLLLKKKREAYDGKGNIVIENIEDFKKNIKSLKNVSKSLYVEKFVPFVKELAVMVVSHKISDVIHNNETQEKNRMIIKDKNIELMCFPVVETFQKNNICNSVLAPATITEDIKDKCWNIAMNSIASLPGNENVGIFGVELFLLNNNTVLFNEIAPRPHNSGHYTQESCYMDQFEAHLRAICDLPINISSLKMKTNVACMVNILGTGNNRTTMNILNNAMKLDKAGIHWYDKEECKIGRKMGHYTITGNNIHDINQQLDALS
jgi:phosphoribosylaminoimidazole carboxylase